MKRKNAQIAANAMKKSLSRRERALNRQLEEEEELTKDLKFVDIIESLVEMGHKNVEIIELIKLMQNEVERAQKSAADKKYSVR